VNQRVDGDERHANLALRDVTVRAGGRTLVDRVSLSLEPGHFVALVGPNGAGKTTLLRAALGLVPVASGHVRVNDRELSSLDARARAAELAWLPQQSSPTDPLPAIEAVMAARYRFRETAAATRRAAERALERVGLILHSQVPVTRLSGGERQRVAIAALLAQDARLLLLDEPANHLDPAQQAEIYTLLGSLRADGAGILCVTHDVNLLSYVKTPPRVLGLARGTLRFALDFGAAELPAKLSELFGIRMLALPVASRRVIVPAPPDEPHP
jgi:iron complex transport system ATP-binding protein